MANNDLKAWKEQLDQFVKKDGAWRAKSVKAKFDKAVATSNWPNLLKQSTPHLMRSGNSLIIQGVP